MKQDRFLAWILVGIVLLVILSLVVYFNRHQALEYGEENSPEGVVRNYVIALLKADYSRAYGYLKEGEFKPDETQFRQAFLTRQLDLRGVSLELGKATITDEIATVELYLIRNANDPFGNSFTENAQATLRRDQDGKWKLEIMPYPYWNWDWYNPSVPVPEVIPAPVGQD
ncbi:MAG: hypothetical protein ANABAC_1612 [Anaerolineae bacterium]|nr:MAG: hypothetical protein ANABAC_1612 [Anaerolineae bacterium]